jgi:hypothetical protein
MPRLAAARHAACHATRRHGVALVLLAMQALPLAARAQAAPEVPVNWQCWYSQDQHVSCRLAQAPQAPPPDTALRQQLAAAPAITPFNRPLPAVVGVLRHQPGSLRGLLMRVPLHTEPLDHEHVAVLVQSVMCGSRPLCSAHYSEQPADSLQAAADFADALDPLLQLPN